VFEANELKKNQFEYKLTTTVMISMAMKGGGVGDTDLSGSMTQQDTKTLPVNEAQPHLVNMGRMLEDLELKIRNGIEGIYIQKTREVINGMRLVNGERNKAWEAVIGSLSDAVKSHGSKRVKDSDV